jgi:histidyl-tRNA synthetase
LSGKCDFQDKDVSLRPLVDLFQDLKARGLSQFVDLDLTVVRGLAYYNGIVFEVFSRAKEERAIAGGGHYDGLLPNLFNVNLHALGFAMGDVVLANFINDTPHAKAKMDAWTALQHSVDIYVVIAKEERRAEALAEIQALRDQGYRVDYSLTPAKVGKQFQTAEQLGARLAVLFGDEWPQLKLKDLRTGDQSLVPHDDLSARLATLLSSRA